MSDSLLEIVEALRAYADWQSAMRRSAAMESSALRGQLFEDRRAHVRLRPVQLDRPMLARLKPGPLLTLLDVSAGGALIQTPARLTPGAHVMIEFLAPGTRHATALRSRVTRSQVAGLDGCVRYRGACSFDEKLELAQFLPPPRPVVDERPGAARNVKVTSALFASLESALSRDAGSGDTVLAVRRILAAAPGLADLGVGELLDDMSRMTAARASRDVLMAHVDGWLRRHVPLLGLRVHAPSATTVRAGDVISFQLPVSDGSGRPPVKVEFRPACALDDSQVRLLEAGACVLSALYTPV
jgi:hypothetical protein